MPIYEIKKFIYIWSRGVAKFKNTIKVDEERFSNYNIKRKAALIAALNNYAFDSAKTRYFVLIK